jgi:hypothetical protein
LLRTSFKLAFFGLAGSVVLLLSVTAGSAATYYEPGARGYDVSYPQCSSKLPRDGRFAIVGVTNGLPWSVNPCLNALFRWADSLSGQPSFYTNTANPGPISPYWNRGGPRTCANPASYNDTGCSYNYGWRAAEEAFRVTSSVLSTSIARGYFWWLDVETENSWNGNAAANSATVQGYYDYFKSQSVAGVGIYSTGYQWRTITGGYVIAEAPNWVAGASQRTATRFCGAGFSGGAVVLVQYIRNGLDNNIVCRTTSSLG